MWPNSQLKHNHWFGNWGPGSPLRNPVGMNGLLYVTPKTFSKHNSAAALLEKHRVSFAFRITVAVVGVSARGYTVLDPG